MSTVTTKVVKAKEMFSTAFKLHFKDFDNTKIEEKAQELANFIAKHFSDEFPKIVRGKVGNLKENKILCSEILNGKLSVAGFMGMKEDDLKTEEQKNAEREIIEDSVNASREAKVQAETDMFTCSKCKKNKCTYYQLQTRSCDEPMTTFVTCTVCGNNWKFC